MCKFQKQKICAYDHDTINDYTKNLIEIITTKVKKQIEHDEKLFKQEIETWKTVSENQAKEIGELKKESEIKKKEFERKIKELYKKMEEFGNLKK